MQKITIELEIGTPEYLRVVAALAGNETVAAAPKKAARKPATAKATPKSAPAVAATPPAETPAASKHTKQEVNELAKVKAKIDRAAVKDAIKATGADKIANMEESKYDEFMEAISLIEEI